METIKLEDVLVVEERATPQDVCGKLLGQVTKGQLVGVINGLPAGLSTGIASAAARKLPTPISFQEDEE